MLGLKFNYDIKNPSAVMRKPFSDIIDIDDICGKRFKIVYQLVNLDTLKSSLLNKLHIFQCMGKVFCVELQRVPLCVWNAPTS